MQSIQKLVTKQAIRTQAKRTLKSHIKHPLVVAIAGTVLSYFLTRTIK